MAAKVELVYDIKCSLGEGPHWDHNNNTLLFVDINNSIVHRWNPVTNAKKAVKIAEPSIGAVVPRRKGGLVVAAGQTFSFLDEETGKLDPIHKITTPLEATRFNDGKCDPFGRFWAGTMGAEEAAAVPVMGQGELFCLDVDGKVTRKAGPVDISNGLSWTADKKTFYYTDSLKFCIDAYDYDVTTGEISNMREVVKFDREQDGIPDGHCIDTDGNLWVAMYWGGQLIKVDPKVGQKVDRIKVSDVAKKTTSVCFGGPNMDEMYMTCARNDLKDGQDDCSGSIFKITGAGARGPTPFVYQG